VLLDVVSQATAARLITKFAIQSFGSVYATDSQLQNFKASRSNSKVKHSRRYNTAVHNCNIKMREYLVE